MLLSILAPAVALFLASYPASASPQPLSTKASTTALMQAPASSDSGLLIHVLRTEDLIADRLESKPLLLEKLSHLIIRVQIGKQSVNVNGHSLPVLPSADQQEPLEVVVKLQQVQMLKLPKDSPLVPLGLTSPELLKISDEYMSEGLVGAMLVVTQEPVSVEALRRDGHQVQAAAYKVTIAIKILQVEGLVLEATSLPAVDLLHLIVHPDPENPAEVATITMLASPDEPQDQAPSVQPATEPTPSALKSLLPSGFPSPFDLLGLALAATTSSLDSALSALHRAASQLARHAHGHTNATRHRHHHGKPCKGNPAAHAQVAATSLEASDAHRSAVNALGAGPAHDSNPWMVPRRLACLVKIMLRSSMAIVLFGFPLLFVFLLLTVVRSKIQQKKMAALRSQYQPINPGKDHVDVEKSAVDQHPDTL